MKTFTALTAALLLLSGCQSEQSATPEATTAAPVATPIATPVAFNTAGVLLPRFMCLGWAPVARRSSLNLTWINWVR